MAKVRKRRKQPRNGAEAAAEAPRASLGERLRQAREARGLDPAVVAERLHLKQVLVLALEAEDWERLPARVFVRGYYRNYARLLELPEESLLREFDNLCPEGEECAGAPPVVAQGVHREIRSSHGLVRLVTWLVVISLAAAFLLWWRDRAGEEPPATASSPPVETTRSGAGEVPGRAPLPQPRSVGGPVQAKKAPRAEKEPQAAKAAVAGPASPAQPETAPQPPVKENPAVVPLQSAPVIPAPQAGPGHGEKERAERPQVELKFLEDSWVDIRGADGSFKLTGIRKAGERVRLGGRPPYHMILGNARGVRLLVNGEPFDLTARTRRNVARLTLNP